MFRSRLALVSIAVFSVAVILLVYVPATSVIGLIYSSPQFPGIAAGSVDGSDHKSAAKGEAIERTIGVGGRAGNYASESYLKKLLVASHFITKSSSKADLFFLPFSIARLRHDRRVDVGGIADFIQRYVYEIMQDYPFWNRSGGADHFYVACHSAGRSAMNKAEEVKLSAIQVVCSASYFLSGYVAHKDVCLPQIWPRKGDPPGIYSSQRSKLAFFAGTMNSPVRERLLQLWGNDSEISVFNGRLSVQYSEALLSSRFCLHVKGFEVNTARIADAIFYGCVPVIIANHYDLPFTDILNWKKFSLVVATLDIPHLRDILKALTLDKYLEMHQNLLAVRMHFQWHTKPRDYDAFHMVLYEIWLRRNVVRPPLPQDSQF